LRSYPPAPEAAAGSTPSIPFLQLYEIAHLEHRPTRRVGAGQGGAVQGKRPDRHCRRHALSHGLQRLRPRLVEAGARRSRHPRRPGGHSSALQAPHVETLAHLFQGASTPRWPTSMRSAAGLAQPRMVRTPNTLRWRRNELPHSAAGRCRHRQLPDGSAGRRLSREP
jgi:hypothetical protein